MAPARAGDPMVGGVRRTGSAEPKAPPLVSSTTARTTMTAAGTPIASHRPARRCGPAPADSGDRVIPRPAGAPVFSFLAPIPKPPAPPPAGEAPGGGGGACPPVLGLGVRGLSR